MWRKKTKRRRTGSNYACGFWKCLETPGRLRPSNNVVIAMLRIIRSSAMVAMVMMLALMPLAAADKKSDEPANVRTVQGTVSDATGNPLDGAVVQLKNMKTLQIRSFISKDSGTYYFHGLSTDVDYELKADSQGASSGTKTLSSFDSRKKAIINLQLKK